MRLALIVLLLATLLPMQALAHAQLRAADPGPGTVLAAPPASVTLTFNEPVAPLVLRWIGPDGAMTEIPGKAAGNGIIVVPPDGLARGTHFLSWRVVSADGHPVGGTHSFHIGAPSAAPPATGEPATSAARAAAAARALLTAALAVALGTILVPALVTRTAPDARLRQVGLGAAALGGVAAAALLGVQGLDLLSLPPAGLLSPAPWLAVRAVPLATTVLVTILALGFVALALMQGAEQRVVRLLLALTAWALGAASFATSGHAATAEPEALARTALVVHGAALLFWTGALWPLLRIVSQPGAAAPLARFSTLAAPLVALLVLSGAILTWLQAGAPAALLGSAWGLILMGKLGLAAVLVGLAVRNRLVLTPALSADPTTAAPRLGRAIRAEIVLGLAIVALASCFRLAPPPRALIAPAEPLYAHIHGDRAMADIRLTPGRAGPIDITLGFQTGDFAAFVPKEVEVIFAQPEAGIEPIRLDALQRGDGTWQAGPVTLPRPGSWEVTLRLLVTDFESIMLTDTFTLPE
jgi:copper transport protein